MSGVHLYAPAPCLRMIRWHVCHDCKKLSPFAILCYEWHGPSSTCMRCGRDYNEDGMVRAPFMRGWREENKRQMRKYWKAAAGATFTNLERVMA